MIASIIQAVALFAVTNIDDIIVLALFFARGAKQRNTTRTILLGQYLGFFGILVIAAVASYGAVTLLPAEAIPYFGLIPLALGIKAAWDSIRGEDDDDTGEGKSITLPTVAAVTFANGGDNIGVYVPVFVSNSLPVVIVHCVSGHRPGAARALHRDPTGNRRMARAFGPVPVPTCAHRARCGDSRQGARVRHMTELALEPGRIVASGAR